MYTMNVFIRLTDYLSLQVSFCGWIRVGQLSSITTAMICQLTTTSSTASTSSTTPVSTSSSTSSSTAIAEIYFRVTHQLKGPIATTPTTGATTMPQDHSNNYTNTNAYNNTSASSGVGVSDTRSVASGGSYDADNPYNNPRFNRQLLLSYVLVVSCHILSYHVFVLLVYMHLHIHS